MSLGFYCYQRSRLTRAYNLARHRGAAAGDAMFDGYTTVAAARTFIEGYEASDEEIMLLAPSPCSGEYAGESIPELFDLPVGAPWPTDEQISEYENNFLECWWAAALYRANAIVAGVQ